MKVPLQALSHTIEAIYAAGSDPEQWPAALERIGDYFDGEGSLIRFYDTRATPTFIHPKKLRSAVTVYLDERWWKQDLHAQRAIDLNLRGFEVMSDHTVASDLEIQTHPIFTNFFYRFGLGWLMSCPILPDQDERCVLSVPRAKAKGPFTPDEMQTLSLLGRHVDQALRISLCLSNMSSIDTALTQALDAIDTGVHTLSADGRILFSNRVGRVQCDTYFDDRDGCLTAKVAGERDRFKDYLATAQRTITECAAPQSCVLTGTDGTQLVVWATPVGTVTGLGFGQRSAAAILVLATPFLRQSQVDPAVLRDCLQLTISEARLASLIGCGMPIERVAEALGITVGTARNVLKTVFRKAGVNRQTQLALKISNLGRVAL